MRESLFMKLLHSDWFYIFLILIELFGHLKHAHLFVFFCFLGIFKKKLNYVNCILVDKCVWKKKHHNFWPAGLIQVILHDDLRIDIDIDGMNTKIIHSVYNNLPAYLHVVFFLFKCKSVEFWSDVPYYAGIPRVSEDDEITLLWSEDYYCFE